MATFTGTLKLTLDAVFGQSIDIGTLKHNINYTKTYNIANGTAANQANQIWVDNRSVAASTADSLDLAGALADAFGNTITFTAIKGIIIIAGANGDNLVVGGAASNTFINWVSNATDEIVIKPNGMFALFDPSAGGYAVTASTGDILDITNADSAAAATYDIILIGEAS